MRYVVLLALFTAGCSGATTVATVDTTTTTTGSTTSVITSVPNCREGELATTAAYTTIAGVDKNLTSLDIYPPSSVDCDAPVVMWVHATSESRQ